MTLPARVDAVVVGGGIAGLAAAWTLVQRGREVVLLEAGDRCGGKVGSQRVDGYLLERGPNSFLGSARALWPLIVSLGLEGQLAPALPPGYRWIYRDGRLRRLPTGPWSALAGDWLSLGAKLRVLAEWWVRQRQGRDETLFDFVARRCGPDFAAHLIAPFTHGVYAGDARQLGAFDAFPRMWRLEAEHGGLLRGALATLRQRRQRRRLGGPVARVGLWNFAGGLQELADALVAALGPRVRLGATVCAIAPGTSGRGVRLEVRSHGADHVVAADAAILALPAAPLAALAAPWAPAPAAALAAAPTAAVAVVHLGLADPGDVAPRGFGALIAAHAGVDALGVLWPSSLFAGRAPAGHALAAVFLGGVHDPGAVAADDAALTARAVDAIARTFGPAIARTPTLQVVTRWPAAIPQYVVGYRDRVAALRGALAAALPAVQLAGAACDGVSIDDAAASGVAAADALCPQAEAA